MLLSEQQHCSLLVSGAQLQSIVERSCPGESVTFTCTISSLAHQWSIPSLGIIQSLLPNDQGRVISNSPFQFNVTEVITGSYIISTATVNATADLNGTTVLCQDGIEMHQDQSSTIMIIGKCLVLCLHTNLQSHTCATLLIVFVLT